MVEQVRSTDQTAVRITAAYTGYTLLVIAAGEKVFADSPDSLKAELPVCAGIFLIITAAEIGEMPLEDLVEGVSFPRQVLTSLSVRKIEESSNRGRTPVIAVTAASTITEKQIMFDAGCDSYISKPGQRVRLLKLLSQYLGNVTLFIAETFTFRVTGPEAIVSLTK